MDSQSFFNLAVARSRTTAIAVPQWFRAHAANIDRAVLFKHGSIIVAVVSNIGLMTGIVFSIYQFLAYQQADRVKYTFQYVEKYDDERFLDARRAVSEVLRSYEKKIASFNTVRMNADAEEKLRGRFAMFLVNDSNDKKGIAHELDLLVSFFSGVQICIEKKLCDKPVANAFLKSHADSLWTNFGPYIKGRRDTVDNYGLGLELFLKPE